MTTERYEEICKYLCRDATAIEELMYLRNQAEILAGSVKFTTNIICKESACPASIQKEELDYVLAMEILAAFNNKLVDLKTQRKAETH